MSRGTFLQEERRKAASKEDDSSRARMQHCSNKSHGKARQRGGVGALGAEWAVKGPIGLLEKPLSRQRPEGAGSSRECYKHTKQVQRHWGY